MRSILRIVIVGFTLIAWTGVAHGQSGYDLFQRALVKERSNGQIQEAIELYRRIVSEHTSDRALTARALVQMGRAYEKLGSREAQQAYERVVREYADQSDMVAQARTRLAALTRVARAAQPASMTLRRIWAYPESRLDAAGQVSADGRYLPVEDMVTGDLMIRDLATGENRYLTHNAVPRAHDVGDAQVSPDGRWIAYNWDNNEDQTTDLRIVGLDGSGTRVLYSHEEVTDIVAEGWSPDGANVLVWLVRRDGTRQIAWVSVADGSVRVLKTLGWRAYPRMRVSPDGRYIAYDFAPPGSESSTHGVRLLAADGSRETPLFEHPGDDHVLGWTPDGKSLLFESERSGTEDAWVIQIDDGKPQGPPELVKKNIGGLRPRGITQDGAFYYTVSVNTHDVVTATLDPVTGEVLAQPTLASQRFATNTISSDWSPDGAYLAYHLFSRGDTPSMIGIRSLDTGEERAVSLTPRIRNRYASSSLRWSPDGRSLTVGGVNEEDQQGIYKIDARTGHVTPIVQSGSSETLVWSAEWSPDGRVFFYGRVHGLSLGIASADHFQILARNVETGQETEIHRLEGQSAGNLALSPDGQRLAFAFPWPRARNLTVIPAAGGQPRELLRLEGQETLNAEVVAWTPDGRYIFFGKRTPDKLELWRISADGGEPQRIDLEVDVLAALRVHPDGRRIAFTSSVKIDEVWVMENFLPQLEGGNK